MQLPDLCTLPWDHRSHREHPRQANDLPPDAKAAWPTPHDFYLGTPLPYLSPTSLELCRSLRAGKRYAHDLEARLHAVLGQRITEPGLVAVLRSLWPVADWQVQTSAATGLGVRLVITATDRHHATLLRTTLHAWRWSDDALELNIETLHIDPVAAAVGLSAAAETLAQDVVRALCRHPDARCTVRIPGSGQAALRAAQRGYLFADAFGMLNPEVMRPQDAKMAFTAAFCAWIDFEPTLRTGAMPTPTEERDALKAQAMAAYQPREFLRIGLPNLTVQVPDAQGHMQRLPVGTAFFLHGPLPAWCGLRFVNSLPAGANGRVGQLRAQSQVACGSQLHRELDDAHARSDAWRQQVWNLLGSDAPAARAEAYRTVGLYAPAMMRPILRQRLRKFTLLPPKPFREQDPQALAALHEALALLDSPVSATGTPPPDTAAEASPP